MRKLLRLVCAAALFACPILGQQQSVAFTNARLIPITGPEIERGTIVVQGGKITAIGPSASVR
ncbi:MAG TPA: hypothetical protein PKE66_03600, partial [Pyrinomonadaceae bacterium]|nr:hypothetical protein [Pyrinomonadaceae bacterium]